MKRPSLNNLAHIAEIVAAVGVVVSLIYVGIEIRANTAAVRSASIQAITNASASGLEVQMSDADLSRIRRIGDMDYSALDEDEAYRYFTLWRRIWLSWQNVYIQQGLGVIDDEIWRTYERIICQNIPLPGVRTTWPDHSQALDPGFVRVVEDCPGF